MTIIKHQSLLECNVRKLCVKKDYFTCGANEEYFKMFDYIKEVSKKRTIPDEAVYKIAKTIYKHSDFDKIKCDYSELDIIASLMFEINDLIVTTFAIKK